MRHQLQIIRSRVHNPSLREHSFFGQEQVLVNARIRQGGFAIKAKPGTKALRASSRVKNGAILEGLSEKLLIWKTASELNCSRPTPLLSIFQLKTEPRFSLSTESFSPVRR